MAVDDLTSPGAAISARLNAEKDMLAALRPQVRALADSMVRLYVRNPYAGPPSLAYVKTALASTPFANNPAYADLIHARMAQASSWEDLDDLADPLMSVAARDARTQHTADFNDERLGQMVQAGARQKMWVTMRDKDVRHSHAAADGQTVGVTEQFQVGGELLQYPGDPSGSPAQIYNCRCVIVWVKGKGDAPSASAPTSGWWDEPFDPKVQTDQVTALKEQVNREGQFTQNIAMRADIDDPDPTQAIDSLSVYTSGANSEISDAIRSGDGEDWITGMDKAFTQYGHTTTEPHMVYRGVLQQGDFDPGNWRVGDEIYDPNYTSVSANYSTAVQFANAPNPWMSFGSENKALLHIKLPGGTRYLAGYPEEYEMILPRQTRLVIRKIVERPLKYKKGTWFDVYADVVG